MKKERNAFTKIICLTENVYLYCDKGKNKIVFKIIFVSADLG